MKRLKFSEPSPHMILSGKKTTTWRVNDDKDLSVGDNVQLCYGDGKEFAKMVIFNVRETTFGELTNDDWNGHEKFSSDDEMYETYSKYYNLKVTPETKVKVIKFRVL